ncbi:MAG: SLC13 family permease [Armatimonas sp.]
MTQVLALSIFALVYIIILAGENSPRKLDRPAAGLIGGVLMVVCGVLNRKEAIAAIDFGTIGLLFGMMVLIHYATLSGLLDRMAGYLVERSKTPQQLLWILCFSAGILSALFVNDTICLLMVPLVLTIVKRKNLPPEPYLIALATSSNVGSVMTLTGNPQNMLIGQSSQWTWAAFALRMVPVGLVCLVVNALIVGWLYRKPLREAQAQPQEEMLALAYPLERKLAIRTLLVLVGLLVAFLAGAPMDVAAMAAGVTLLIWANREPEKTFAAIDWSLLLFFAGLFVVVEGVTKTEGAWISRLMPLFAQQKDPLTELSLFSFGSVVGSNLFSNVPFVMLLRTWVPGLPHASLLWLALAASSTLAGNLTLLGSVANLIVAQGAKDVYPLSFKAFLRVGVLTTTTTVLVSIGLLYVYNLLRWV